MLWRVGNRRLHTFDASVIYHRHGGHSNRGLNERNVSEFRKRHWYWIIISAINSFGQPLHIASIVLILYGLKHFGRFPLAIAVVGGILLYAGMYLLGMSLPLMAISALILAMAYGFAYGQLIKRKLQR